MWLLVVLVLVLGLIVSSALNVALHAQLEPGKKVVGSVLTTDGMKAAFQKRHDVDNVSIFYPFSYTGFLDTKWDLLVIEGWFPGMHEFIFLARASMADDGIILFFCLDHKYPGLEAIQSFDVDGYLTNSHEMVERLGSVAPTRFVMLGADPDAMAPNASVARDWGAVYVGAGGQMLHEKPRLQSMLEAAVPHGLRLHGSGWAGGELGPLRDAWQGFLPREDLAAAYASAHVVLAATIETQASVGMVNNRIFEALACGALVATDYSAVLEEEFGDVLVLLRSPEEVSGVIKRAQEQVGWADDMRRRARERVMERHTWGHRLVSMMAFKEELSQSKRARLSSPKRGSAGRPSRPKLLWLQSELLRAHSDFDFVAAHYRTFLEARYDVDVVWSDAVSGGEIDGDEYDVIFAPLSAQPGDPVLQALLDLPQPSLRAANRRLGMQKLQKVVCVPLPADDTEGQEDATSSCTANGMCSSALDVGSALGTACDVVLGRSSVDIDHFKRTMVDAGTHDAATYLRVTSSFGAVEATEATEVERELLLVCVWEYRKLCTASAYRDAERDGEVEAGSLVVLLVGEALDVWEAWSSIEDDPVTRAVSVSVSAARAAGRRADAKVIIAHGDGWVKIATNAIAASRAIFYLHPGDGSGGGAAAAADAVGIVHTAPASARLWPVVAAAVHDRLVILPAAHAHLTTVAVQARTWGRAHLERTFSSSIMRAHGLASVRSYVSATSPPFDATLTERDFLLKVYFSETFSYVPSPNSQCAQCLVH
jgi:hypothetical protein